jgi:hypothetical protein
LEPKTAAARGKSCSNSFALVRCYLIPLFVLGIPYVLFDPALSTLFWRNWFRAACGPLVSIMIKIGYDPNDLATYAVAFLAVWPIWLVVVCFSPLKRLPLAIHRTSGVLWCLSGFCLTFSV